VIKRTSWRGWTPTAESIEAVRAALCSHWTMATHATPHTSFWTEPGRWLHRHDYHFTSGGKLIR
jgi:hypothetical protein